MERLIYRFIPNVETLIEQYELEGFEVRGYSEYSSDGIPRVAEMVKWVSDKPSQEKE